MHTLRKGDRVQLTGTVGIDPTGRHFVQFDGDDNATVWMSTLVLARATILPRKLEVGDPVLIGDDGEFAFRIEAITGPMAALSRDGILNCIKPLADLTPIDSDDLSDDGKGAE